MGSVQDGGSSWSDSFGGDSTIVHNSSHLFRSLELIIGNFNDSTTRDVKGDDLFQNGVSQMNGGKTSGGQLASGVFIFTGRIRRRRARSAVQYRRWSLPDLENNRPLVHASASGPAKCAILAAPRND